jgi:hypothetical protein
LFCIFLLFVNFVTAHNPRIVFDGNYNLENPIYVDSPSISKAYYAELKGEANYYLINSKEDFNLYLNILVPNLNDSRTDFVVEIFKDGEIIKIDGKEYQWQEYFEEFARDNYLKGPEFEQKFDSGKYLIKVSNPDNIGKYTLAIGKEEFFPLIEIINVYFTLPTIKSYFFEKSWFSGFVNVFGLALLIFIILFVLLVWILFRSINKKKEVRKHGKKKKKR